MSVLQYNLYDKHGIPILPGDTLKVFHYVAALRREHRYMYKYVLAVESRGEDKPSLLKISHLNLRNQTYWQIMDNRVLYTYEVVQGFGGVKPGEDYRDRKRAKVIPDIKVCPLCESNTQVWVNQLTNKLTCHRYGCNNKVLE